MLSDAAPRRDGHMEEVYQWDAAYSYELSGCGLVDCDGLYRHSTKHKWRHGAPVYVGKGGWLLHRGPLVTAAATVEKHHIIQYGWIICKDGGLPAYGVQSEDAVAPDCGWRALRGRHPAPETVSSISWEDHLLTSCTLLKDKGNFSMQQNRYAEGESRYTEGISCLEMHDDLLETCDKLQQLLMALYANRAEARLRLRSWEQALDDCHWVLWWDAGHAKAIVRAAKACRGLAWWDQAVGPLRWLLNEGGQPNNKDAQELLEQAGAIERCKSGESPMSGIYQDVQTLRKWFHAVREAREPQTEFELTRASRALCKSLMRLERALATDRGLQPEVALVQQGTALTGLAVDILLDAQAVGWSVELLGACIWPNTREDELRQVLEVLQSEAVHLASSPDEAA